MRLYVSSVRIVSRRIKCPISHQLHTPHSVTDCLKIPLLTCRVHGLIRLFPYPYTSIRSIELKTTLVRLVNMFPINSSMSELTGLGEV